MTSARAASGSGSVRKPDRCFALRSASSDNTNFGRNFFCWAMTSTAWIWSSVASSSSQNARAAFSRWSTVMRFQSFEGVSVGSVIILRLGTAEGAFHHMRKPTLVLALTGAAALSVSLLVSAQQAATSAGVHPISGRRYAQPMSYLGADWLDRSERVQEEEPDIALDAIKLVRGSTVADVGAGSGYMTVKMSKRVGPTGKVYANDIQPEMLSLLQQRLTREKITNVEPVLGTFDDPKLPNGTLDLILMVDVYHEFSEPQKMLRRMHENLKPGG